MQPMEFKCTNWQIILDNYALVYGKKNHAFKVWNVKFHKPRTFWALTAAGISMGEAL